MIRRLYPNGKKKAFNITFDDGITQDIRFVEMMNKYGLKGTFNLNSGLMENEFEWTHKCGLVIKRLPKSSVVDLYKGHEIASHTLTHPFMNEMSEDEIMHELVEDKKNLEELFGCEILGFAIPFDYYSELIKNCAKKCGFEYSRMSEERYSYEPPSDYFNWAAGTYHVMPGFEKFVEEFFEIDEELALCQIVGHAYDLDTKDMWEKYEDILKRVSEDDVESMTNLELVQYLKAMRSADISQDRIVNNSDMKLWFECDGQVISVSAREEFELN